MSVRLFPIFEKHPSLIDSAGEQENYEWPKTIEAMPGCCLKLASIQLRSVSVLRWQS
jgi:hypothetical protein